MDQRMRDLFVEWMQAIRARPFSIQKEARYALLQYIREYANGDRRRYVQAVAWAEQQLRHEFSV